MGVSISRKPCSSRYRRISKVGAAQVHVAVAHAQVVAAVGILLDGERGYLAGIEYLEVVGYDLYVAGGQVLVLGISLVDLSGDLQHEFAAELVGTVAEFGVGLVVEDDLRDAVAVAQVDERHAAHVADTLHPAGKSNLPAGVGEPELTASSASVHICQWSLPNLPQSYEKILE